jgi:hypothetical protein
MVKITNPDSPECILNHILNHIKVDTYPIFAELSSGDQLLRIVSEPQHFKFRDILVSKKGISLEGRFDHLKGRGESEEVRKILYAAPIFLPNDSLGFKSAFFCCLAEMFGSKRGRYLNLKHFLGTYAVKTTINLLDLRKCGSMGVGTVAAIMSIPNRDITQAWSMHFYDRYRDIDGLLYSSAHNQGDSVALYERSETKLELLEHISISQLLENTERDSIFEFMKSHLVYQDPTVSLDQ